MRRLFAILHGFCWLAVVLFFAGCADRQRSALDPAGLQAARISREWWFFLWISVAIYVWVLVVLLFAIARG